MKERMFVHRGREFTLIARGPEDKLSAALAAVEALVRSADHAQGGLVEAYDCTVRIGWA